MKAEKCKSTSPRLSSLLNNNNKQVDTPMKEYLPTPVTPASDFSQFHNNSKKDTSAYSTFSVIKPPPSSSTITTSTSPTTPTTTVSTITRSNNTTTPNDVKPYPCPECHQTFSRPHNLKSHLTTHSSERPFQCDVCNHHFRRHHDLKRHQKLHTGERPYVCKDCYRSFARLDALNRHRRAEGGTACSAVHQQVKQELEVKQNLNSLTNATAYRTGTGSSKISSGANNIISTITSTSPQRPVIPQLHIPHPASHLYPKDNHAHTSPIPPTHSPPSQPPPPPPPPTHSPPPPPPPSSSQNQLLPSPSALSSLPIANNNNLTPIYQPKSLPNTPSSPTKSNKLYHPYQPWSAYRNPERPTLPPLSASPPANYSPKSLSNLDRLLQENDELKRDINQIRAMAQKEAGSLKSRVHDLEVENKVLRSLIHNPSKNDSTFK